ncbi:MAG: Mur ligase family protein [Chlamydiota bacterium]
MWNNPQVIQFQVDSREVKPGDLFCALEGERTDGHHYVQEALQKGASFCLVKKRYQTPFEDRRVIYVDDPLTTLQEWAKNRLTSEKTTVIGITGSLGKTTTKEFLKTLLEKRFSLWASPKNYNSQIGLPLSVLNAPQGKTHMILEMGMTKKGHIQKLVEIAPPKVALINNISYVHIENFSNLEGIWEAKQEIFSHPNTKVRLIHHSLRKYCQDPSVLTFGEEPLSCKLPFTEKPFIWNFMAARAVAKTLGLDEEEIAKRAACLKAPSKRFEKCEVGGVLWINDAYNASIDSIRFALESLPKVSGKKWAVLGPMVELGTYSQKLHEEVGRLAAKYADATYSFGEEGRWIVASCRKAGGFARHFPSKRTLFLQSMRSAKRGDVVLVKASRKYALDEIFSFFS